MRRLILPFATAVLLVACKKQPPNQGLFRLVPEHVHKINFENTITESDTFNILTVEYIYNGGGVAMADFNDDGLTDIFLLGNLVGNRLYLNEGGFSFKDVSEAAGIMAADTWNSAVALADVNCDGLTDIYICTSIVKDPAKRRNKLFINKGVSNGVPVFAEESAAYGLDDNGHSSGAAFFDYDNDGDLDLYVLTNTIERGIPTSYRPKINDGSALNTDRLYRNNGNGTFTNVSKEAGIVYEGYGLGISVADINQDGWPDVYVSNDYIANDLLYINNKDGSFTNAIDTYIRHQSHFSMGNDIADINNDGLPDIITLDMLPEGNLRKKTVINGTSYTSYINNAKYGYSPQYIRNMLQLNNGDNSFSEIGLLAGIHQTEWSWAPLFADFDNDGHKDLIVTNGFPRDITDKDFGNFRSETSTIASAAMQLDSIPVVKVPNYAFRNNGDLTFADVTGQWGMNQPSFSNGAAYADLDNDGDLDLVINNINDKPFVYENTLVNGKSDVHYLRLRLSGSSCNRNAIGARVTIFYDSGRLQYHEFSTTRGYISVVEPVIHFGLGTSSHVDSLLVEWPDGKTGLILNPAVDTTILLDHTDALKPVGQRLRPEAILKKARFPAFVHAESDFIDFNIQRTIPHKFSEFGPGIAVGDINSDGLEDLIVGGAAGKSAFAFFQRPDGTFAEAAPVYPPKPEEDTGLLLVDVDLDGDLDLYATSGSIEFGTQTERYRDRLYLNNGKGVFSQNINALPDIRSSELCVRAADFDADGDLDLFIGGKIMPGEYPNPASSTILINQNGVFENVTSSICPELERVGMVSDAIWTDYDNDGKPDLIVVGEFMPISVFRNTGAKLERVSSSGLEDYKGWWNSIAAGDFDRDGDIDYVVGNLGLNNYYKANTTHPLKVFAKDIDNNGSVDAVLACYFKADDGSMQLYPVHFWDELNSQSPKFRKKFKYYKQYGKTSIDNLFTPEERQGMLELEANYFASSYIENHGNGKFTITPLPTLAQLSVINGIVVDDVNGDGHLDILAVGNDYGNEVFSGRLDALNGVLLVGNGKGKFKALNTQESGFYVPGNAKGLVKVSTSRGDLYVATVNRDSIRVFSKGTGGTNAYFKPEPLDMSALLYFRDGSVQKVEFSYGSGFLSQSSRAIKITGDVVKIIVKDSKGNDREVRLNPI